MINLLPPDEKHQLRAARANTLLIRYNILLLVSIAFLGLAVAIVYFYLFTTKTNAEQAIAQNTTKVSDYSAIEAQTSQFRSNLAVAKQILDREVAYTKVILEIARLLPSGVILTTLNLDSATFGTETTLAAQAKDYASALALKDSFQKSPLFSNVHFQNITADSSSALYPVSVNLVVTINKDATK